MPAYNPIKYIINNTNKNEPGFRYIFTIYPSAGSHIPANVVAQYKVLPTYGTGYGEQDISLLMQSLVTYDESAILANDMFRSLEPWYQYDVDLGYEYIDNIEYITTLQDNGGNVRISFTAHGFLAGDQIIITQDGTGPTNNPALEGLHTVLSATANNFTVNVLWSTIGESTANGNVTYADLRKTVVLDDYLITDKEVFNGAYNNNINTINEEDFFPSANYLGLANPTGLLMTSNYASQYYPAAAFPGAQFHYNLRVYEGYEYEVIWYDMDGNSLDNMFFESDNDGICTVFVGPTSLVTQDYYVYIHSFSDTANQFYYFTYDNRCTINDQQLIYLDRMGSWQSFAFQLRTYEKGQITREQYNQHIDGFVSSNQWRGVDLQKGSRTYNTNVTKTFDLNTNWMGQYDAKRFQELLTSPQVYYYSADYYCACVVDSSSFEVFSQKNKKLIKQSVTIKLAQQDPING
jgi:hypothetical protein